LLAIWGETLAELGDLEGAIERAKKGVELAEHGGDMAMLGWSYNCLARVLFSTGDLAGAQALVGKTQVLARESSLPPWIAHQMAMWQVRIWLAEGQLDAAVGWARERGLDLDGAPVPPQEMDFFQLFEQILLARMLLAQDRPEAASGLLDRLLEPAQAQGRTTRTIEIHMLQALAFQARAEPDQAKDALQHALSLAKSNGFFQIWIDEGPPMARLLYEAAAQGILPDYTGKLLAAFPAADTPPEAQPQITKSEISRSGILEPLSERELEVLALFAEGLTNQEIASRLFLSLNTVKAHSRNIYGKLGVHSRTRAVAKARALGLLPTT
jgi:LuxR family maltose regulon positive regulatory protein